MSNVKEELATYFQSVERRLHCSKKCRDEQLKKIIRAAEEYALENPDATPKEAEEYLGKPEEVARELMESIDPEVLERDRKRRRVGLLLIVGVLAVVLCVMTVGFVYLRSQARTIEVTETVVIYAEEETIP